MMATSYSGSTNVFNGVSAGYQRLKGKACIITGAASGLGEKSAYLFASHGANLILADVQDQLGKEVAAKIGPQAIYVHCDVSNEGDVASLVESCIHHFDHLDVLFNNAAILPKVEPLADLDMAKFALTHNVNVQGVALGLKYGARVMTEGGSIINTSSVAATMGSDTADAAYISSKHAVLGLTKAAAIQLGQRGIRVNSVAPGPMYTPMVTANGNLSEEYFKSMMETAAVLKVKDGLRVEDVANAALFLASDESRYINGHNLVVDGGVSIVTPSFQRP